MTQNMKNKYNMKQKITKTLRNLKEDQLGALIGAGITIAGATALSCFYEQPHSVYDPKTGETEVQPYDARR